MNRFRKPSFPSSSSSTHHRPFSVFDTAQHSDSASAKSRSKSSLNLNSVSSRPIAEQGPTLANSSSKISYHETSTSNISLDSSDLHSVKHHGDGDLSEAVRGISLSYRFKKLSQCPVSEWNFLDNITSIILSNNVLTEIPDDLCKLPYLRILSLSKNQIARVNPNITELASLESLNLSSNLLTTESIDVIAWSKIPSLRSLLLIGNSLTKFPQSVIHSHLETLSLSNNEIDEIPNEIINMRNLQWLGLSHNRLTNLEPLFSMHPMSGVTFAHNCGLNETEEFKRRVRHLARTMRMTPAVHVESHVELMTRVRALTQQLDRQLVRELARHSAHIPSPARSSPSSPKSPNVPLDNSNNPVSPSEAMSAPDLSSSKQPSETTPPLQQPVLNSMRYITLGRSIDLNHLF